MDCFVCALDIHIYPTRCSDKKVKALDVSDEAFCRPYNEISRVTGGRCHILSTGLSKHL